MKVNLWVFNYFILLLSLCRWELNTNHSRQPWARARTRALALSVRGHAAGARRAHHVLQVDFPVVSPHKQTWSKHLNLHHHRFCCARSRVCVCVHDARAGVLDGGVCFLRCRWVTLYCAINLHQCRWKPPVCVQLYRLDADLRWFGVYFTR